MYYVSLAGRNYNLEIRPLAVAGGQLAVFRTILESCNGPRISSSCDIEMGYYWATAGAGDGYGQITIFSGSGEASTTPAPGNALTSLVILNITASCAGFNAVEPCTSNVDTTTTTTTTSTTTTTTTIAGSDPGAPTIKFDQYSSSYSPSTWANVGSGGSGYNLTFYNGSINTGGSGTGAYLGLTGSLQGQEDNEPFLLSVFEGGFVNLYNKSFSYSAVFRVESPLLGFGISSPQSPFSPSGLGIYGGSDSLGPYIQAYLYGGIGATIYGPLLRVSTSPKWYLVTLTFDKTAASSAAAKVYLNLNKTDFTGNYAIPNPSTFFLNSNYSHFVGATLNPVKVAAIMFWSDIVLTQAQVQYVYNEYNTRYTLG